MAAGCPRPHTRFYLRRCPLRRQQQQERRCQERLQPSSLSLRPPTHSKKKKPFVIFQSMPPFFNTSDLNTLLDAMFCCEAIEHALESGRALSQRKAHPPYCCGVADTRPVSYRGWSLQNRSKRQHLARQLCNRFFWQFCRTACIAHTCLVRTCCRGKISFFSRFGVKGLCEKPGVQTKQ